MGHLNSKLLWHKYAQGYFTQGLKVLEIGPAGHPSYFEKVILEKGLDVDYHTLDVRREFISGAEAAPKFILSEDSYHYPIVDNSFDIVFSDQVLAHVPYFWDWYKELKRITKIGGHIITICAHSYPPCPSPIDAWRVHSDGMLALNEYIAVKTILSITESLEKTQYNIPTRAGFSLPGASITSSVEGQGATTLRANKIKMTWNKLVGRIPKLRAILLNPIQVSYDTITIAKKEG